MDPAPGTDLLQGALVVAAGGVGGLLLTRRLAGLSYRRGEERSRPAPRSRWWVAPACALAWLVLWWQPLGRGRGVGVLTVVVVLGAALVLVALAAIDLDVHRIPDLLLVPAAAVSAVALGVQAWLGAVPGQSWSRAVAAAGVVGVGYLVLALLTAQRGGLGLGDVKLAAWLGGLLGWWGWGAVLTGLLAGAVLGGATALLLLALGRAGRGTHLAYGPALAAGAWLGLLGPHDAATVLLG